MWSRPLLDALTAKLRRNKRAAHRRQARRLFLEGLETRNLMAFNVLAEYPTGDSPADVLLADINGDGQADMIVAGAAPALRLGHGDGTFGAASSLPVATNSIAVGDLDGDGAIDLVATVTSAEESHLSILRGNGDGTFQPPVSLPIPTQTFEFYYYDPDIGGINSFPMDVAQSLSAVAVGDLNADGRLDLVATGSAAGYYEGDEYVNVFLGNGNGSFTEPTVNPLGISDSLPGGYGPEGGTGAVAIADLNNDGHNDVVTSRVYSGMNVLLGDGAGALGSPIHSGRFGDESSLPLGDVDGDGILDTLSTMGLAVQRGDGAGSFVPQASMYLGYVHQSAEIGDMNGDGLLDLVVVGFDWSTGRKATVLLGDGSGQFTPLLTDSFGGGKLGALALADLTGDGLPDMVTIDHERRLAVVALNDADHGVPATVTVSDAVVEENSSSAAAVFTVTITGEHSGVTIDYSTVTADTFSNWATPDADYVDTAGTLTFAPGESSKTISIPILDDSIYEGGAEFFSVRLSQTAGLIVNDSQGLATIWENDPAPLLSIGDVALNEGNHGITVFSFPVSLSEPSAVPVRFLYRTADGTAVSDFTTDYDYNPRDEMEVVIEPGQTSAVVTVEVMDDTKNEADEIFFVDLYDVVDATLVDGQAVGTILNDDTASPSAPPTIDISDAEVFEGNSGTRLMTFTVTLSHASNKEVRVSYGTQNGTARTSDSDYVSTSGTLKFAPGQTTKTITVKVKGDKRIESDEMFYVRLSGAKNGVLGDGEGVGTIWNDDSVRSSSHKSTASYAAAVDAALHELFVGRGKARRK